MNKTTYNLNNMQATMDASKRMIKNPITSSFHVVPNAFLISLMLMGSATSVSGSFFPADLMPEPISQTMRIIARMVPAIGDIPKYILYLLLFLCCKYTNNLRIKQGEIPIFTPTPRPSGRQRAATATDGGHPCARCGCTPSAPGSAAAR